jgi:CRISPR-associated endonuclease Cas2
VFECDLASVRDAASLKARLRELIDPAEDQIRLYPLDDKACRKTFILGARTIEEHQDFCIVT